MQSPVAAFRIGLNKSNFELANAAAIVFVLMGVVAMVTGGGDQAYSYQLTSFIANFIFLHGFHAIFHYWMIHTNPEFKKAVETSSGIKNLSVTMMLLTFGFFAVFFLTRYFSIKSVYVELAFAGWATLHTMGQTYGIYCAKMAPKKNEASVFRTDYKLLKFFVYFTVVVNMLMIASGRLKLIPRMDESIQWGLSFVKYALLIGAGVWLFRKAKWSADAGWILFRLSIGASAIFLPYAGVAVAAIHGAEYFDLARKAESRTDYKHRQNYFVFGYVVLLFLITVLNYNNVFDSFTLGPAAAIVVWSVEYSITVSHYLFDTIAFKFKNAEVREAMIEIIK